MYTAISYVIIHTYDCITNYILCTLLIIEYVYIAANVHVVSLQYRLVYIITIYIYSILIELMMVWGNECKRILILNFIGTH